MRRIWEYRGLVFVLAVCVIMGGMMIVMMNMKLEGNFKIVDIAGDRKALDDVMITGEVRDKYHKEIFTLRNNKSHNQIQYLTKEEHIYTPDRFDKQVELVQDGKRYFEILAKPVFVANEDTKLKKVSEDGGYDFSFIKLNSGLEVTSRMLDYRTISNDIDVRYETYQGKKFSVMQNLHYKLDDEGRDYRIGEVMFSTELIFNNDLEAKIKEQTILDKRNNKTYPIDQYLYYEYGSVGDERSYQSFSDENNGITRIGDDIYCVPLVDERFSGIDAIYHIDEFYEYPSWKVEYGTEEMEIASSTNERGKCTPIYRFDLNETPAQVIGLEGVGKQLVLILSNDDKIHLRSISTEGEVQDEYIISNCLLDRIDRYEATASRGSLAIWLDCYSDKGILVTVEIDEKGKFKTVQVIDDISEHLHGRIPSGAWAIGGKAFVVYKDWRDRDCYMKKPECEQYSASSMENVLSGDDNVKDLWLRDHWSYEWVLEPVTYIGVYCEGEEIYRGEIEIGSLPDWIYDEIKEEGAVNIIRELDVNGIEIRREGEER